MTSMVQLTTLQLLRAVRPVCRDVAAPSTSSLLLFHDFRHISIYISVPRRQTTLCHFSQNSGVVRRFVALSTTFHIFGDIVHVYTSRKSMLQCTKQCTEIEFDKKVT